MTPQEFDAALASALRICRAAAQEKLPFAGMLEYLHEKRDGLYESRADPMAHAAVSQVEQVVMAVEHASAIGASLPPEPTPIRVPEPPSKTAQPVNVAYLEEIAEAVRTHIEDCECWRCTAGRNAEERDLG